MDDENAEEWLESWVDENIQTPGYYEDKSAMRSESAQCREDAKAEGISEAALIDAAGGDLEAYVLRAQNAFTEKAEKED